MEPNGPWVSQPRGREPPVHPFLRLNPACLVCSQHLSPDDPPAIKELVDDFDGVTLLEGQLVLLHGRVAFLDNVLLTCRENRLFATTLGWGSASPASETRHQNIYPTF